MSHSEAENAKVKPPMKKIFIGGSILIVGFLSPLFIPLVLSTSLSDGLKAILSGLLAFGIPEIFMIIAVAVMGKEGFNYIMGGLGEFLKPLAPPDMVSKTRYTIGLFMFFLPIAFGFLAPYIGGHLHISEENELIYHIAGDVLIFFSLFVLGGHFWDKIRSLFLRSAKVVFPPKPE